MRLPGAFSFCCPLKINCGTRALTHLPMELLSLNARTPLILANRDRIGRRHVRAVVDAFRVSGLTLGIYDHLPDRLAPDLMPVLARIYRDGGCDSIVVVGSGSVVDVAKWLNLLVSADERGELIARATNGEDPGPLRPMLLVATTGGDGNEVSGYASDGDQYVSSPRLIPAVVLIDPAVMDGSERDVINGALIGLAHAAEAIVDPAAGPMSHAYAHTAISLIMHHLPMALRKIERRKSLSAVVNGQVAAGCAFFASSPGICHTLANQLKESSDLPMGLLLAIFLPHLLREAGADSPELVGGLLHPIVGPDALAMTATELKVPRVVAFFWEFYDALNGELTFRFPTTLNDAGVTDEQIDNARKRLVGGPFDDYLPRIIDGARQGVSMMSECLT